jgi:hypothetical protein
MRPMVSHSGLRKMHKINNLGEIELLLGWLVYNTDHNFCICQDLSLSRGG